MRPVFALTSGNSPYTRFRRAPGEVQTALSGPAGVTMGFPGALEELTNLCRESAE
jgi:hypothetical protein